MRHYGRFVDGRTIRARMDRKDARLSRAALDRCSNLDQGVSMKSWKAEVIADSSGTTSVRDTRVVESDDEVNR